MQDKELTLFNNMEAFNDTNSFYGKRVYLLGTFSVPKTEIIDILESVGAIVRSIGPKGAIGPLNLAKTTCVIVAGKNQSRNDIEKIKILSHDGFHIPIITEEEMRDIANYKKHVDFPTPVKQVDITYDFLFNSIVPKIIHFNFYEYTHLLGQKELFLYDIKGEKELLYQSLGNIGAYSNFEFDPKTIDYCWLKRETIEKLKKGEKDEFVKVITDKYNSSNNDKFTYKFIIESEAICWMEFRAREVKDDLSLGYITRYLQSVYGQ